MKTAMRVAVTTADSDMPEGTRQEMLGLSDSGVAFPP